MSLCLSFYLSVVVVLTVKHQKQSHILTSERQWSSTVLFKSIVVFSPLLLVKCSFCFQSFSFKDALCVYVCFVSVFEPKNSTDAPSVLRLESLYDDAIWAWNVWALYTKLKTCTLKVFVFIKQTLFFGVLKSLESNSSLTASVLFRKALSKSRKPDFGISKEVCWHC